MRIQRLPAEVANQIAAGEVIERPASVVKELLENASDAGADAIGIDIGFGGLNQIVVSDNGHGIVAEDLPLAIAAHATSKIRQLKDLEAIQSLGFRGEALASIASVSRVTIRSRTACQSMGMMLTTEQGEHRILPVARAVGTSIEVKDIFYNAPVRKKFLKSERAEFLAIDAIVRRFALASPAIAIDLRHNGQICLQLQKAVDPSSCLRRRSKVLGKAFVDHAIWVELEQPPMRLYGWVSAPGHQRAQNDRLWIYLNGRMVRDKLLLHAVKQAYEGLLDPGRHPVGLLYLNIEPQWVDVNVHPTKHEVRFQEPRLVHDFISVRLREMLRPGDGDGDGDRSEGLVGTLRFAHPTEGKRGGRGNDAAAWVRVNPYCALVWLEGRPYLVDVRGLQRAFLKNLLETSELPLRKRPLLVSVRVSLEGSRHSFASLCEALSQIGIDLASSTADHCLIQSLPVICPELTLPSFFAACCQLEALTMGSLYGCVLEHQAPAALHWDADRCIVFEQYLQTVLPDKPVFIKELSIKHCEDFLNMR